MKHKAHKLLALVMSILMLVNSVPVNAFATETHDHSEAEHTHSLKAVEAKEATCAEDGNTAYWYCDCGAYFSDAEGSVEIEKDSWL